MIKSLKEKDFNWGLFLALVVAGIFLLNIVHLILRYWVNLPFWDDFADTVPLVQSFYQHTLTLADLWSPHNPHRVVITRLLYLFDASVFAGNTLILLLLEVVIQSVLFALLAVQLKKLYSIRSWLYCLTLIAFSALVFAPQMGQIWFWGFVIQQTLTPLFFCAAIFSVHWKHENVFKSMLPLLFALLTTLSSFNGLIVWPALVIMLWLGEASWRRIITYSVIGILVIAAYAYHITADAAHAVVTLSDRIAYFFVFIGSTFSNEKMVKAYTIGVCAMVLYVIDVVYFFKQKNTLEVKRQYLPWLTLSILALGSAILGSIGRVDLGVTQAISDRYIPISALFWYSLIIMTTYLYRQRKLYKLWAVNILTFAAVVFLIVMYFETLHSGAKPSKEIQQQLKVAAFALKHNVYVVNTPLIYGALFPDPLVALKGLSLLKEHNQVLFHNNMPAILIGSNIKKSDLVLANHDVAGQFNKITPANANINTCAFGFLRGFAATGTLEKLPGVLEQVYLLDSSGVIVGFGIPDNSRNTHWTGFVVPPQASTHGPNKIQAYVKLRGDNKLYSIPGVQYLAPELGCSVSLTEMRLSLTKRM